MSIAKLPKGGVNKGIIIPLKLSCPYQCVCQSSEPRVWLCLCGSVLYLSEYGDVFCENHLKNCSGQFIKDKCFQCDKAKQSNSKYYFQSMSQLIMSLSKIQQALESTMDQGDLLKFCTNIMSNISKRWNN